MSQKPHPRPQRIVYPEAPRRFEPPPLAPGPAPFEPYADRASSLEESANFHGRVMLTNLKGHLVESKYQSAGASVEQLCADFADTYAWAIRMGDGLAGLTFTASAPLSREEGQRPTWPTFPVADFPVSPQMSWGSFWTGTIRDNDLRHCPAGHVFFFRSAKPVKAKEFAPGVALVADGILAVPRLARWPMSYSVPLAEIPARLLEK